MSQYKVIQDIEAEDKLVGALSMRQFIYAGIAALCLYLCFLAFTKNAAFLIVFFFPIACAAGFFAFPWSKDQPTEIWALAKIRFYLKPRKRIWDQSGAKELVTITAPKRVERVLTNGLNQGEVNSRLRALADTIDSRGWAVKDVNVNMYAQQVTSMPVADDSDRLVSASILPQEVSNSDVSASDDIMDETANPVAHHFDDMIQASSQAHRQQLMTQMQQPDEPVTSAAPQTQTTPPQSQPQTAPNDYWFMNQPASVPAGQAMFTDTPVVVPGNPATDQSVGPQAATPTPKEQALVEKFKAENSSQSVAYGHMKVVKTMEEQMADDARAKIAEAQAQAAAQAAAKAAKTTVTPTEQAAIMNLARNDDLDVATIARQIHKQPVSNNDGEVIISLH